MTLDKYEFMMDTCQRCSKCKFLPALAITSKKYSYICPSIERYNFHAYSGGGRLIMANSIFKGRSEFSEEMLEALYKCTNCGGCEVSCRWLYEIEPNEVIHELRVHAVESGVGPLPTHKKYIEMVEQKQNPYGEDPEKRPEWFPKEVELDESSSTLYFAGCTASFRREEIAIATARILDAAGVGFQTLGAEEICCGSPVYRVGDRKRAIEIMKLNLEKFKEHGITRIVTSCSGCFNMLGVEYPRYVDTGDLEVIHMSQFMETLLKEGKIKLTNEVPLKVTYHDPCHLGRMAEPREPWEGEQVEILSQVFIWDPPMPERIGTHGVYDAPRNVLQQIPGIELIEMERIREYAYCCGAGGGVKSAFPDFALWTSNNRVEEAEDTGAEALVSCCPFCSTNLQDGIYSRESNLGFYDLTELVWKSIGGGN